MTVFHRARTVTCCALQVVVIVLLAGLEAEEQGGAEATRTSPTVRVGRKRQTLVRLHDPAYWLALCPALHISGESHLKAVQDKQGRAGAARLRKAQRVREDLIEDGYAKVECPDAVIPAAVVQRLRRGVARLVSAGWPATFILVFDECWQAVRGMQQLLQQVHTGVTLACSFDIVAWHVDPGAGQAGFSPHRDRQPEDWTLRGIPRGVPNTFTRDRDGKQMAKYNTCWLALSGDDIYVCVCVCACARVREGLGAALIACRTGEKFFSYMYSSTCIARSFSPGSCD